MNKRKTTKKVDKQECEDVVREVINSAVKKAKSEILPRVELIDLRDKEQYEAAKKIIQDTNMVMYSRIENTERIASGVKKELDSIIDKQEEIVGKLTESLDSINNKLDIHLMNEEDERRAVKEEVAATRRHLEQIQVTLDNVSANGNKGLSNSMTDLYKKVEALHVLNAGKIARAKMWTDLNTVFETSILLKPLRSKWGAILYFALALILVNTITHSLGFEMDIASIFEWIFNRIKFGL